MTKVDVFECPSCSSKVVILPLNRQQLRGKHCDNPLCNADFSFANNQLVSMEVPDDLARRGYFTEVELHERRYAETKPQKAQRRKNLKGVYAKQKRRSCRPGGRGR